MLNQYVFLHIAMKNLFNRKKGGSHIIKAVNIESGQEIETILLIGKIVVNESRKVQ